MGGGALPPTGAGAGATRGDHSPRPVASMPAVARPFGYRSDRDANKLPRKEFGQVPGASLGRRTTSTVRLGEALTITLSLTATHRLVPGRDRQPCRRAVAMP